MLCQYRSDKRKRKAKKNKFVRGVVENFVSFSPISGNAYINAFA